MTDKNKTAPAAATAETEKGKYTTDIITQAVQKIKVGATANYKNGKSTSHFAGIGVEKQYQHYLEGLRHEQHGHQSAV